MRHSTAHVWASNCPTARATLPTRPGCPRSSWRTMRLRAGPGWCVSAPTSWRIVMSRNDRPIGGPAQDGRVHMPTAGGWAGSLTPSGRQAHIYRPGTEPVTLDDPEQLTGDPDTARLRVQSPRPDFRRTVDDRMTTSVQTSGRSSGTTATSCATPGCPTATTWSSSPTSSSSR